MKCDFFGKLSPIKTDSSSIFPDLTSVTHENMQKQIYWHLSYRSPYHRFLLFKVYSADAKEVLSLMESF